MPNYFLLFSIQCYCRKLNMLKTNMQCKKFNIDNYRCYLSVKVRFLSPLDNTFSSPLLLLNWVHLVSFRDGDNDEDIATLGTLTPSSFSSCNSSPTHLPRHSRIQQTCHQCFDHNFFILHWNRVILDSLERGQWRRHFGSSPSSRSFVD